MYNATEHIDPGRSESVLATSESHLPASSRLRDPHRSLRGTLNCKIIGLFSIENHHVSGTILHYLCIFNRKFKNMLVFILQLAVRHCKVKLRLQCRSMQWPKRRGLRFHDLHTQAICQRSIKLHNHKQYVRNPPWKSSYSEDCVCAYTRVQFFSLGPFAHFDKQARKVAFGHQRLVRFLRGTTDR